MQKRYRFTNGFLEMSFEMRTGECIEMINCQTGENILKCHSRRRGMPFRFFLENAAHETIEAYPTRNMTLFHQPELYARYHQEETEDGPQLTIFYPSVETAEGILPIEVQAKITLLKNSMLSRWEMSYVNKAENITVSQAYLPSFSGIYLGESWRDDALLYPMWRGVRVENPVETLSSPSGHVGSRWMEYFQGVQTDHMTGARQKDGAYQLKMLYGHGCCMRWMALTDPEETFYFGSHDPELRMTYLDAETFGLDLVGMNFSFGYCPEGPSYTAPPAYAGLFPTWHEAAVYYRDWQEKANPAKIQPALPPWVDVYADMVVHYDFKDQCGDIQHHYRDLPSLKDFCLETGLKHLMLAGWDKGGFNVRMPYYRYDEELGTEDEFRDGVRALKEAGIHVSCYVNADVVNREEEADFPELFEKACVVGKDGKRIIRVFSNKAFVDHQMCSMHPMWLEHLRGCVHYLTDEIGCDGVYFDCLSGGEMCYGKDHGHKLGEHVLGRRKLLETLTADYTDENGVCGLTIFGEALTDALGPYLSGQLGTSFMNHKNAFPEMYRYAFPNHLILDMVYPFRSQGMRAAPVSYWWKELIDRVFLNGMNYWLYDDEEYGSFRNDPVAWDYLKNMIRLRIQWFSQVGRGRFEDTVPFGQVSGGQAKAYTVKDGQMLIACVPDANAVSCTISLKDSAYTKARLYHHGEEDLSLSNGSVTFNQKEPCYIILSK